jgi:hypothetical protein
LVGVAKSDETASVFDTVNKVVPVLINIDTNLTASKLYMVRHNLQFIAHLPWKKGIKSKLSSVAGNILIRVLD